MRLGRFAQMKVFRQTFDPILDFLGSQNRKRSLLALVKVAELLRFETLPCLTACRFHRLAWIENNGWPPPVALSSLRPHDLAVPTEYEMVMKSKTVADIDMSDRKVVYMASNTPFPRKDWYGKKQQNRQIFARTLLSMVEVQPPVGPVHR